VTRHEDHWPEGAIANVMRITLFAVSGRVKPTEASCRFAYAVERAAHPSHVTRNSLHCAGADAEIFGSRQHALAGPQLALDSLFQRSINLRTPEPLTPLPWPC
jgi:hypothetical protein